MFIECAPSVSDSIKPCKTLLQNTYRVYRKIHFYVCSTYSWICVPEILIEIDFYWKVSKVNKNTSKLKKVLFASFLVFLRYFLENKLSLHFIQNSIQKSLEIYLAWINVFFVEKALSFNKYINIGKFKYFNWKSNQCEFIDQ